MMNLTLTDAAPSLHEEDAQQKRRIVSSDVPSPSPGPECPVVPSLVTRRFGDASEAHTLSAECSFTPPKAPHRIGSYLVGGVDENSGRRRAVSTINPTAGRLDCFVLDSRAAQRQIALRVHLGEPNWLPSVVDTLMVGQWTYFLCVPTYGSLLDEFGSDCVRGVDENRAAELFGQIVEIVDYCHSRGVVLRDLTLRCFSFEDEARTTLKLLSIEHAEETDLRNDRFACRFYACPEMFDTPLSKPKGVIPYSGRGADVWSLGIILYALLVGCYPFFKNSQTAMDISTVIKSSELHIPGTLSGFAVHLLQSMLRRDPEERLTITAIQGHPFLSQQKPVWVLLSSAVHKSSRANDQQCVPFIVES